MKLRPYQQDAVDGAFRVWENNRSALIVFPTGCHHPDTLIMDYSGHLIPAKSFREGMELMGPDSKPRQILKIHNGIGKMYKIIPVKGDPFIVNEDHVLTLVRTNENKGDRLDKGGQIIDVSVKDFIQWTKYYKHIHKLFRVGVNFNNQEEKLPIDPYVLGALIGDGSFAKNMSFTTKDQVIFDAVNKEMTEKFQISLKDSGVDCGKATCWRFHASTRYQHTQSKFRKVLGDLNKTQSYNKFIPHIYKTASFSNRLQFLAGILDTDGHATQGGYDFVSKSQQLANDVAFVARSCGFASYVKQCKKSSQLGTVGTYYRVIISGDCGIIPCRLGYKQHKKRLQKKSVLRTGFKVEYIGDGEYVGFTVGPENHYLMGDFTVTHNCGKTVVFAEIAKRVYEQTKKRIMVLAHREELIYQAKDKIHAVTGLEAQIEMGEYRVDDELFGHAPVIVSTVQTHTSGGDGGGRMTKFDYNSFGLLILDESHHATSGSWRKCIEWYSRNPDLKVLGVTATPDRADEEALGQVFDEVAADYEVMDAIRDGWLVPVKQQMVSVGHMDLSNVHTVAGDLNQGELAEVLEHEQTLHEIATPTIEICGDKRAIVFAATVKQAERLSEIFNRHKPGSSAWICGKTDKRDRKKILADFKAGKTQFVCNVGVLTEGFDDDGVEVIVMARPTKSRSLYAQMAGRGTRPHSTVAHELGKMDLPDERRSAIHASPKPDCLIVDFVGNSGKHKLCSSADILGGKYTEEEVERATQKAKESKEPVDMTEELEKARKELHDKKLREAARRAAIVCRTKYAVTEINPFDVFDLVPTVARGWDRCKKLSKKQIEMLEKQGIPTKNLSYAQGKQLLDEIFRRWNKKLPSFKQQKVLKKAGFTAPMRPSETKAVMEKLAQRWK